MIPPVVHEVQARSALNPVIGMPFKWSLNPYKGCAHGCTYCYARAYHRYLDLAPSSFESQLFVKLNMPELLRTELRRPSWTGESIAIGTATDPYQPLEAQYRLTRRCLAVMVDQENPASITTKGTLVTRDLDLLEALARVAEVQIHISLISLDHDLVHKLEPGAPSPAQRLRAIERLSAAGIPVSVFMSPVLPGITDRKEDLEALIHAAASHGARAVWSNALRLGPDVKEHFLEVIAREFPLLTDSYKRLYGMGAHTPASYQMRIEGSVRSARQRVGLMEPSSEVRGAPVVTARRGQLSLPL